MAKCQHRRSFWNRVSSIEFKNFPDWEKFALPATVTGRPSERKFIVPLRTESYWLNEFLD